VNPLKDFNIQFSGLAEGIHTLEFVVDDKFFNEFKYTEITDAHLKVDLKIDKQATMMVFSFDIHGYVNCVCDRCLEVYPQEVAGNEKIIVKFGDDKSEEDDEVKIIPSSQNQIDISQDLYEFIILMMPLKRVHPEDKSGKSFCNPEIIKILNKLNVQQNSDPRWDALKNISFKN